MVYRKMTSSGPMLRKRPFHSFLLLLTFSILCHLVLGGLFKRELVGGGVGVAAASQGVPIIQGDPDNLYGQPGQGYYIEVQIGTPPQKLNVLIDTGSSNFAVACSQHPDITTFFHTDSSSTYETLGSVVRVPYTQGSWSGQLGQDFVSVTSLPDVRVKVNIACITETDNFYINGSHWQGILGLAYAGIARPDDTVEPFFDSLTGSGKVENLFSVNLCGTAYHSTDPDHEMGGWLLFGRGNTGLSGSGQHNVSQLYSTPIHNEWYYEVVITDIAVNGSSLGMDCKEYNFGKTIVDSGTTNLRLPKKVFQLVVTHILQELKVDKLEKVPEAKFWSGEEFVCWKENMVPYNSFPTVSLSLPVNNTSAFKLVLSPQQYLRPVGEENDEPGKDCFKFAIADSSSGSVLGAIVMEGYYIIFNRENRTVQFVESKCSILDPHAINSSIQWDKSYSGNYVDCAYVKIGSKNNILNIVGYVMAGICGVCFIPLIVMVIHWRCRDCRHKKSSRSRSRTSSDSKELVDGS